MRGPKPIPSLLAAVVIGLLVFVSRTCCGDVELGPGVTLRHWDLDTGLPSPRVFTVAHTPDGYVWMGTYAGLARFDGLAFTTFSPDNVPALRSSSIMALAVDAAGTLWIGTEEGQLLARDAAGFRTVPLPLAAGQRINVIRIAEPGTLWLGTQQGVVVIRGAKSEVYRSEHGLTTPDVTQLVLDPAGCPWALCDGVPHVFADGRWQPRRRDDVADGKVSAIASAASGGIWCAELAAHLTNGRGSRVFRLTLDGGPGLLEAGPWPRSPFRSRIDALLEDATGRLWCATRGSGVYRRDQDGAWSEVSRDTRLARADTVTLTADAAGSLWLGTRTTGVYQVSPVVVRTLRLPASVGDHVVTTVCSRSDGSIWAGTDGNGVVTWQSGTARRFGIEEGLPSLDVLAIAETSGGDLYAGTLAGLACLHDDRFKVVDLPGKSPRPTCVCLFRDRQERLWVGTRDAVVRIDAEGIVPVDDDEGAPIEALDFTQDAAGRVVALSRAGQIHEFVGGRFHRLLGLEAITFPRMRAIAADARGGLWLGNYGSGITYVGSGPPRRWSMQQSGLPNSHLLALVAAGDVIWATSENGVFGCPVEIFTQTPAGRGPLPMWRVTQADGLAEKVCTGGGQPAVCLAADGVVWVPNGRNVAGFLPQDAMRPVPVKPPVVERLVVDGRDVVLANEPLAVLSPGAKRVEFHFTSPNTVAPERLKFRHRLAGFDPDWVPIDGRRMAAYTALPPGDYQFQVDAIAPMGAWQPALTSLALRIPPRWWQRRSVQAGGGLALAMAIAGAGWAAERRRSHRRVERLELERARDEERRRIARDIHDDIGSGLTEIAMLSDIAARELEATPDGATVQRIAERTRALTRAMDEVVWAVNPRNDSPEGFITYLHRWAQAYLANAGLRVRWDLPLDPTDTPLHTEVRHQLFLACKEAVANIVKHAKAMEVNIRCRERAGSLEIEIADDGRGFVVGATPDGGHGLSNLRDRLTAVGGTCDIESKAGGGTTVRFVVPVGGPSRR